MNYQLENEVKYIKEWSILGMVVFMWLIKGKKAVCLHQEKTEVSEGCCNPPG